MSGDNKLVKSILVVGGGSSGYLSALALKSKLPDIEVKLIHAPEVAIIGVGESTTIALPRFIHRYLGLPMSEFFQEVAPSFKLGIRFEWGAKDQPHFNYPFDTAMSARSKRLSRTNSWYSLDGRSDQTFFSSLMESRNAPCIVRGGKVHVHDKFGYHLDAHLLVKYLKARCIDCGVEVIEGLIEDFIKADEQTVSKAIIKDGKSVSADLFVDCSGFSSILLCKTMNVPFRSYADTLFCDRAWTGKYMRDDVVLPYTTTSTMDCGWSWRIDFLKHVTRGYVFSSQFEEKSAAKNELLKCCPQLKEQDSQLRLLKFSPGRYESFWQGNVVAIGNASGFVEPLEATALHLVTEQLRSLCHSLIDCDHSIVPQMRKLQNRRIGNLWDDVRDFLAVHYKFNYHRDTPFWRLCRKKTSLGGASELVDAYRAIGPSPWLTKLVGDSIFGFDGYMQMLIGQRVPTKFEIQKLKHELPLWQSYCRSHSASAEQCMPVREALESRQGSQWIWPDIQVAQRF